MPPWVEARVGRIMKRLNLCSIVRRKSTYRHRAKQWQQELPANILNREFEAAAPGEKFVTDVTYIPYVDGDRWKWAYLSVVLEGKYHCENAIFHSDRGSIYTSLEFQEQLMKLGLRQSLSRSANCWDNAPMESFNGILKTEWLYNPYCCKKQQPSYRDQLLALEEYMRFYNDERIHSSNSYLTPNSKRASYFASA